MGSAPPWALPSKSLQRRDFLSISSKRRGIPVAHVSRVGAEEGLLFDGGSCLALPDGAFQNFESFAEGVFIVDTDAPGTAWTNGPQECREGAWLRRALAMGIKDNMSKQGLEAAVIGLSGGIDSAVVTALAVEAIGPDKVIGVSLPTRFTSVESRGLAKNQAQRLGINFLEVDAEAPFAGAASSLSLGLAGRQFGITDENLQSRCRGMLLMAVTSEPAIHEMLGTERCAVLNTGNKSEAATGYFTLYGDAVGAFGVIGDLLKTRVYAVARELGDAIPEDVLSRPPTAELRPNQTDESSLMPYVQLDAILGALIEAKRPMDGLREDLAEALDGQELLEARESLPRVQRLVSGSEFKRRQLPFSLHVTQNAFGRVGNVPLTAIRSERP
jgi:NAD+ synthase (glutamine-hydrolysing)